MLAPDGELRAVGRPPPGVLEEAFRPLLLAALRRPERLSEALIESRCGWRHAGF